MSNYKRAVIALIFCNIIWGAGPPIFKWSLQNISPLTLVFFRSLIPVIILLPFAHKNLQRVRIRDAFFFVLAGLFGITINLGLYLIGLQYSASINQPVIASSGPIFLLIGSALFLKDKATKKVLFGNLVGLTGVLFIVLQPVLMDHQYNSLWGNILFVLSTIAAVLGTLVSKRLGNRYSAFTLLFWTFFVAAVSLLPIPFEEISHHAFLLNIGIRGIFGILFGAIFSSTIGYGLFYWGLKHIKASETAIFSYVDPVAAIIIASPLLHEYPTPLYLFGSFLVFFGIYIAERRIHWHPLHKLFK